MRALVGGKGPNANMPHRRKTILALVVAAACTGGFGVAVTASGQSTNQAGSYTVGDYTTTTPTTVPSTPTVTAQDETGGGSQTSTSTAGSSGGGGKVPTSTPSTATRRGPNHLAFTGAEPLLIGGVGVALMLAGLMLHRRRRAAA